MSVFSCSCSRKCRKTLNITIVTNVKREHFVFLFCEKTLKTLIIKPFRVPAPVFKFI